MRLDIRTPIGGMFTVLGLVLTLYGLFTFRSTELYERSLGLNVNLWWGLVMLAFGLVMYFLGRRGSKLPPPGQMPASEETRLRGH
jgi:hypothetical protein